MLPRFNLIRRESKIQTYKMKSKRVLIVDDNDLNRKLFENLVAQLCTFKSVKNGLEALDILKTEQFDLILMDIQMPQMDGLTAMKQIRMNKISTCPIMAITAYADMEDKYSFLDQGFDEFLTKPIRPREFLETVKKLLQKSDKKNEETQKVETGVPEVVLDHGIVKQLMKYNSGETIRNVYLDFLKESEKLMSEIISIKSEGNLNCLIEKLHILKGNSGTLGANQVFLIAKECEFLARNNKWDETQLLIPNLKNELSKLDDYIQEETIFE